MKYFILISELYMLNTTYEYLWLYINLIFWFAIDVFFDSRSMSWMNRSVLLSAPLLLLLFEPDCRFSLGYLCIFSFHVLIIFFFILSNTGLLLFCFKYVCFFNFISFDIFNIYMFFYFIYLSVHVFDRSVLLYYHLSLRCFVRLPK